MSIFIRIWLMLIFFIGIAGSILIPQVQRQIKPNAKQIMEETLADNVNILATILAEDVYYKKIQTDEFKLKIQNVMNHPLNLNIWKFKKKRIDINFYITDDKGFVLFDSKNTRNIGKDFSKWNDVYNTLRGKYGVRSSRLIEDDPSSSSVMYVSAPIKYQGKIIGVISISKTADSIKQYIDETQKKLFNLILIYLFISFILCGMIAWIITKNINTLKQYALSLAPKKFKPKFKFAKELNELADAISQMRGELEDKEYIKNYVTTLTHELKSPLTSIKASAELLQDEIDIKTQKKFAASIENQANKLKILIDKLLILIRLEGGKEKLQYSRNNLIEIINKILDENKSKLAMKNIVIYLNQNNPIFIDIDVFWFTQAINNIIDNAIDFCYKNSKLEILISNTNQYVIIKIINEGELIPDYAINKVFDRYFSLPRKHKEKSTGIGLTIVKAIINLHHGKISIKNDQQGVKVTIIIPFYK